MKSKKVYSLQFTAYSSIILLVNCLFCALCYAQTVSSAELINNAKRYDGNTVIYSGEVIGDVMKRGKYSWLNVHDGINAVGIWIDNDLIKNIGHAGNYKTRGDFITVKGAFYRRCIEHGGDLDIHAVSLRKVSDGAVIPEKINMVKRNLAIILAGGLCLVLILKRLKRK